MTRWVFVGWLALGAWPASAHAQQPDSTAARWSSLVAKGDTVRFTLELGENIAAYQGEVREVLNPRQCLFVRLATVDVIRGRDVYSFATPLWPTTTIERRSRGAADDHAWETIRGRQLLDEGIRCLEGNSRTDEGYLNPDSR